MVNTQKTYNYEAAASSPAKASFLFSSVQSYILAYLHRRNGEANVDSRALQFIGGSRYKRQIQALINGEFISCDETWKKREKAKGYRLLPKGVEAAKQIKADGYEAPSIPREIFLSGEPRRQYQNLSKLTSVDFGCSKTLRRSHFKIDRTGRIHSAFTQISKKDHSSLRLGGMEVAEIDLTHAYPAMLPIVFSRVSDDEKQQWYDFLKKIDRLQSRAAWKKLIRRWMFDRSYVNFHKSGWLGILNHRFPTFAKAMMAAKKKANKSEFAEWFARLESRIMNAILEFQDTLSTRMLRKHDAIFVAASKLKRAALAVETVLERFGLPRSFYKTISYEGLTYVDSLFSLVGISLRTPPGSYVNHISEGVSETGSSVDLSAQRAPPD